MNLITYIGYALFVIPGFVLVWTYRHFTRAPKIGEFQYAAWSFFWGVIEFMVLVGIPIQLGYTHLPTVPLDNPAALLGSLVGISVPLAAIGSFPLGFIGAQISRAGFFKFIDKKLFNLLRKISR